MVFTVAASACGSGANPQPRPPTAESAVSSAAPHTSASAEAQCSDAPAATNTASGDGTALRLGGLKQFGSGSAWNIALPDGGPEQVPELSEEKLPDDWDGAFGRAYNLAGAFVYGDAVIQASLENTSGDQLTIINVRPVNIRIVCMPSALLVLYGSEGGDLVEMHFNLEAARPIAHENLGDSISTEPYFGSHKIDIPAGSSETLALTLDVAKRAYTFDIGVQYVLDGATYTQVIRRPKGPFRVMPDTCPPAVERQELAEGDVVRLKAHRFRQIRQRTGELDANGGYLVRSISPEAYVQKCPTW